MSLISLPKTLESKKPNIAISDPTALTSNLHEVMEECIELENQTEQGFEATTRQVEEMNDDNEKNHQIVDEPRKRKRGADEAGEEQRKNRVENFISESAVALMQGSLKNRGFIMERGFKNIISPFAEWWRKENGSLWQNTKNLDAPLW